MLLYQEQRQVTKILSLSITWHSAENLRKFINIKLMVIIEIEISKNGFEGRAVAWLIAPELIKLILSKENVIIFRLIKFSEIFFSHGKAF